MKKLLFFMIIVKFSLCNSDITICKKDINTTKFLHQKDKLEVLAIWYPVRTGMHMVKNLCSSETGLPIKRRCFRNHLMGNAATWDTGPNNQDMDMMDCSDVSTECFEEFFDHIYIEKNNITRPHSNKWQTSKIGKVAETQDLCLLNTGLPLTRKCLYNQTTHSAVWEEKEFNGVQCLNYFEQPIVTFDLINLSNAAKANSVDNVKLTTQLTDLLQKDNTLRIPADVVITANILGVVTSKDENPILVPTVLKTTNAIMKSDKSTVSVSFELDSPRKLLNTVETYTDRMSNILMPSDKCSEHPDGVFNIIQEHTSVFFINPSCSNVSGIAVYNTSSFMPTPDTHYDVPTQTLYRYIYLNQSLEEILNDPHLEVASYVPQDLWEKLEKEQNREATLQAVRFSLYRNTNFFLDLTNMDNSPGRVVMNASIPGYTGELPESMPFIFHNHQKLSDTKEKPYCGNYDGKKWTRAGDSETIDRYVICHIESLSSFQSILYSTVSTECSEETFDHIYIEKNNITRPHTNKWMTTKIGEMAKMQNYCLLKTGLPLTRKCLYNQNAHSAAWEQKEFNGVQCLNYFEPPIVTFDLINLSNAAKANNVDNVNVTTQLTDLLLKDNTSRIAADLVITANILEVVTSKDENPKLVPTVLNATSAIMQSEKSTVRESFELGSPSKILSTVETYTDRMSNILMPSDKCSEHPDGVFNIIQKHTSVFFINPSCSNISGIAVYNTSSFMPTPDTHYDVPTQTLYRYIYLNQSLEEILNDPHLEVASYVPQDLWEKLEKEQNREATLQAVRFSLYRNTNFFLDLTNMDNSPGRVVMNASIPGYTDKLPVSMPFIFRNHQILSNTKETPCCGSYDGEKWTRAGDSITKYSYVICHIESLSSFKSILYNNTVFKADTGDIVMLTIPLGYKQDNVSITGIAVSLCILLFICITAPFYKQWHPKVTVLLFNICLVVASIMIYLLCMIVPEARDAVHKMTNMYCCISQGGFLQYLITVLFLWMLILAKLQQEGYVTVRRTKYVLMAWVLPAIPTALTMVTSPQSYVPLTEKRVVNSDICYLSGGSLYGVLGLLISIIIGIFHYSLCSFRYSVKKFKDARKRQNFVIQVRLSLLLFLFLGTSWILGIWAHMVENALLSIFFCLASVLQVFILFLYFVIIGRKKMQLRANSNTGEEGNDLILNVI